MHSTCHYDAAKNVEKCSVKATNIWKFSNVCNNKGLHEIFIFVNNLVKKRYTTIKMHV